MKKKFTTKWLLLLMNPVVTLFLLPPLCISRPDSFARADQGPVQIQHQDQDPPAAHREQRRPALAERDEEGQGVLRHLRLFVPDVRRRPQAGAWRKPLTRKSLCLRWKTRKINELKWRPIKKNPIRFFLTQENHLVSCIPHGFISTQRRISWVPSLSVKRRVAD